ncbi:hypothetical protein QYF61_001847 [Mycteria americana]|uniref:Uncharacterized protein n=1 Tax=Mycteria americana TaxID=33587 RepID=A0AAN7PAI7_MYCAM|nr:hypothetical protein QYF61_001847 [Mycteria americana]
MASHPSRVSTTHSQLGVICKLAEGALDLTVHIPDKDKFDPYLFKNQWVPAQTGLLDTKVNVAKSNGRHISL